MVIFAPDDSGGNYRKFRVKCRPTVGTPAEIEKETLVLEVVASCERTAHTVAKSNYKKQRGINEGLIITHILRGQEVVSA